MTEHALPRSHTTCGPALVVDPHSPVAMLATRAAVTVPLRCSLADAVEVMVAEAVSSVLLEGRTGIVTERDLAWGSAPVARPRTRSRRSRPAIPLPYPAARP